MDDVHYLAESLYHPDAYIVPGFNPGMPIINKPPIGLTDKEILCVIAWLQSLGGTPSVTMDDQAAGPDRGLTRVSSTGHSGIRRRCWWCCA